MTLAFACHRLQYFFRAYIVKNDLHHLYQPFVWWCDVIFQPVNTTFQVWHSSTNKLYFFSWSSRTLRLFSSCMRWYSLATSAFTYTSYGGRFFNIICKVIQHKKLTHIATDIHTLKCNYDTRHTSLLQDFGDLPNVTQPLSQWPSFAFCYWSLLFQNRSHVFIFGLRSLDSVHSH